MLSDQQRKGWQDNEEKETLERHRCESAGMGTVADPSGAPSADIDQQFQDQAGRIGYDPDAAHGVPVEFLTKSHPLFIH